MLIQKSRIPVKEILLIGILPCFIKKLIYRLKGYKIGKGVSIGFGSVICAEEASVGDHTAIGFLTIIRGKSVTIGSHVSIGATTILDTPYLEIGDGSKINEQVFVGGLQFPDSKFVLGKNCQIMQMSFLNPAKSIVIGDDSGIGGDCLVFGHTTWLSEFEGYPVEFSPIEIGNSVSIAWRVFLLPGSKIGDGAVVGANSLVHRTIPPKCLAVGFPARVVSKFPDFPKEVTEEQKVEILDNIVHQMLDYFNGSGLFCTKREAYYEITQIKKTLLGRKKKTWCLGVAYEDIPEIETIPAMERLNVFISLKTIPKDIRKKLNADGVMWLDIEKKERPLFWNDFGDEVALFIRRYGVRFYRVEV